MMSLQHLTRPFVMVFGLAIMTSLAGCATDGRQAGNLGTRVCVINNSSQTPTITWQKMDTATLQGPLGQGAQACAEGTFFVGDDVTGTIALNAPIATMSLNASNPWAGPPGAWLRQRIGTSTSGECAGGSMNVNDWNMWDDSVVSYTVARLNDDQWKEFTVTLTDSEKPSSDQRSKDCFPGSDPL